MRNFDDMIRNDIPTDLTFEQFKALAEKQPDLSGAAVYRLEHALKDDDATYPQFEISSNEYFFLSLDEAEKFMREKLVSGEYSDSTYRFVISRIPVGENTWYTKTAWVYDKEGVELDRRAYLLDEDNDAVFFGRTESRLRFHKGDIVEVVGRHEVTLAVVAADGPTVEWFWGLYNRSKDKYGYRADDTDDCYYIIDGPGYAYHSHPNSLALMPLSMPLDDDLRDYFMHCLECADKEDCREKYQTEFWAIRDVDELGETYLRIIYDIESQRHRLQLVSHFATDEEVKIVLSNQADRKQLESISQWLSEVMYGRTRLWYLIRSYNEDRNEDHEPPLDPFTTFNQLISD